MTNHNPSPATRGRPRGFDIDAAVERAMNAFWSTGYHGTSLPALLEATHLSRGSLYAAFGDKHGLFLRALDRYIDDALDQLGTDLGSSDSALAGIRTWLGGYVERTRGDRGKRGCLVVATAMELAAHDPQVNARITRFFQTLETHLLGALSRARNDRELAEGVDPADVAHMLLCFVEGMRVVAKTSPAREKANATVMMLLDRLRA